MELRCASHVGHVTVYARGALVTRRVELPDAVPDGELEVVVEDVGILAEPGSVRAVLGDGTRQVVAVAVGVHVPAAPAQAGPTVEWVRDLERRLERHHAERAFLEDRRRALTELALAPVLRPAARLERVDDRMADALATAAMLDQLTAEADDRLRALARAIEELARELATARLADAQATSAARQGTGHPTRRVSVRIAGDGPLGPLELVYAVPAARWWPAYTLRFRDGGRRAAWALEAHVAHRSGEDWRDVELSLATADLVTDARLPELPALRLGRAAPPPRPAYRPAPAGLERMFEGYDRAVATAAGSEAGAPPPRERAMRARAAAAIDADAPAPLESTGAAPRPETLLDTAAMRPLAAAAPRPPVAAAPSTLVAPGGRPPGLAPPGAPLTPSGDEHGAAPTGALEPAEDWLHFDALVLAPPGDRARRGRLVRQPAAGAPAEARRAAAAIEALAPAGLVDPLASRGRFDHRHDAIGRVDVPSDGRPHRVTLDEAEADATVAYRTIPRAAPEVYKEARLVNPFAAPLLAGPADVLVDGSLLATATIEPVDAGGAVTVGLGVEDRVRVARNVRVAEESGGLLGGSTVVETTTTIELVSSLAAPATVEVIERVPVSDDRTLEVAVLGARPAAEPYDQAERGAPVRGGRRWRVELPPTGRAALELRTRMTFPAKQELVGGNRRD